MKNVNVDDTYIKENIQKEFSNVEIPDLKAQIKASYLANKDEKERQKHNNFFKMWGICLGSVVVAGSIVIACVYSFVDFNNINNISYDPVVLASNNVQIAYSLSNSVTLINGLSSKTSVQPSNEVKFAQTVAINQKHNLDREDFDKISQNVNTYILMCEDMLLNSFNKDVSVTAANANQYKMSFANKYMNNRSSNYEVYFENSISTKNAGYIQKVATSSTLSPTYKFKTTSNPSTTIKYESYTYLNDNSYIYLKVTPSNINNGKDDVYTYETYTNNTLTDKCSMTFTKENKDRTPVIRISDKNNNVYHVYLNEENELKVRLNGGTMDIEIEHDNENDEDIYHYRFGDMESDHSHDPDD
jgi:hypothetical protein